MDFRPSQGLKTWRWADGWWRVPAADTSDIPADVPPPAAEAAAIAYGFLLNGVNQQNQDIDSGDVKLGILFASGTGFLGVLAAALALRPLPHGVGVALLVATFIPYAVVAACCVLGIRRGFVMAGPPVFEIRRLVRYEPRPSALYATLLPHLERAFDVNERVHDRKDRAILYAYRALVAQLVIFLASICCVVVHA